MLGLEDRADTLWGLRAFFERERAGFLCLRCVRAVRTRYGLGVSVLPAELSQLTAHRRNEEAHMP